MIEAELKKKSHYENSKLFYETIELVSTKPVQFYKSTGFLIIGFSIIFFFIISCVFGFKYFKLKKKIQYKIDEIKNGTKITGLNSSQIDIELENKETNKFKSLMEDEDKFN